MTSPPPRYYYDPTCSYCGKDEADPSNQKIMLRFGKDVQWVCCMKCLKAMAKDMLEGEEK